MCSHLTGLLNFRTSKKNTPWKNHNNTRGFSGYYEA